MQKPSSRLAPMAKEKYLQLIGGLHLPENFHYDFIYEMYETVLDGLAEVEQKSDLLKIEIVDHPTIIYYLIGEHYYNIFGGSLERVTQLEENEKYQSFLLSSALDKYLTNGHLEYKLANRYSQFAPPISTLELYLNFTLGTLTRFKKKEPNKTLIIDISANVIDYIPMLSGRFKRRLDFNLFKQKQIATEYEMYFNTAQQRYKEGFDAAVHFLAKAKTLHDELEAFYIPHMDFTGITQFRTNLIEELESSLKN